MSAVGIVIALIPPGTSYPAGSSSGSVGQACLILLTFSVCVYHAITRIYPLANIISRYRRYICLLSDMQSYENFSFSENIKHKKIPALYFRQSL